MNVRPSGRIAVVIGPLVAAGLFLGACGGGGSDAATRATIALDNSAPTNYQTLPIQTTPTTPAPGSVVSSSLPEGGSAPASEYTIQSGDYPLGVADDFGVGLAELAQINGWANCDGATGCPTFPGPGTKIKIPAGGTTPSESDSESSGDSGDTTDTVDPDATGSTIPESGDNCAEGKYTIKAGDIPNSVASDFGVSFERLQAANPGIDFQTTFSVGLSIVIPAKDDC
jgi:LysM repeat protein